MQKSSPEDVKKISFVPEHNLIPEEIPLWLRRSKDCSRGHDQSLNKINCGVYKC